MSSQWAKSKVRKILEKEESNKDIKKEGLGHRQEIRRAVLSNAR